MILNESFFTEEVIDEYDMFSVCGITKDGYKNIEEYNVEYDDGAEKNPVYYNKAAAIYKGDGTICYVGRRADSGKYEIISGKVFLRALDAADTSTRSFGLFDKFLEALDEYYSEMYSTRPEDGYTKIVITIPNRFYEIFSSLGDDLDVFGPADAIVDSANRTIRGKDLGKISKERNGLSYTIIFPSSLDNYSPRDSVDITDGSDVNVKAMRRTRRIISKMAMGRKRKQETELDLDLDELDVDESFSRKTSKYSEDINLYRDEYFDDLLSEDVDGESVDIESLIGDVIDSVKELGDKFYADSAKFCSKELEHEIKKAAKDLAKIAFEIGDACEDNDVDEDFDLGDTIHDAVVAAAPAAASAAIPLIFGAI